MSLYPNDPRAQQDEYAPMDYSYVSSVSEGRKLEQQRAIHRGPSPAGPIVRHRAEPDYGIPENPFEPPAESQQPARRRRSERAVPSALSTPSAHSTPSASAAQPMQPAQPMRPVPQAQPAPQGPQFEAPAKVEIPDWLKVAQQNNMPVQRPQGPRVHSAPRQQQDMPVDALGRPLRRRPQPAVSPYEQAGYPPELLEAQRQLEAEAAAQPIRRRHGAQYAAKSEHQAYMPPPAQPAPSGISYPPPRPVKMEPEPEVKKPRRLHSVNQMLANEEGQEGWTVRTDDAPRRPAVRIPWLGILAGLCLVCALVFFVAGMYFNGQTQQVLDQREEQRLSRLERHPLKYRQMLEDKAAKYNLSPAFVAAIVLNESSFKPEATSHVDARGLMQLMDDTASWIYTKLDRPEPYNFNDLYDAETNLEYGCWYLGYLAQTFRGDPILVAAAFHAGQNEVQNWLNDGAISFDGWTMRVEDMTDGPTKQYVERVLKAYAVYKRLYYGG